MENLIKVNRPIFSNAREYKLGKGLELRVNLVCNPMIHCLCEALENDPYCLVGDIGRLYARKQEIDEIERLSDITYREHLENKF